MNRDLVQALKLITEELRATTHVRSKALQDAAYIVHKLCADLVQEPVKEEPVKEEPVKEEPVKEEPVKEEPVTLDDVRKAATAVMKADKTKKAALHALLKKHGAERVSELDESKFKTVKDAIEGGKF